MKWRHVHHFMAIDSTQNPLKNHCSTTVDFLHGHAGKHMTGSIDVASTLAVHMNRLAALSFALLLCPFLEGWARLPQEIALLHCCSMHRSAVTGFTGLLMGLVEPRDPASDVLVRKLLKKLLQSGV